MPDIVIKPPTQADFEAVYALLQQLWPEREMSKDRINQVYLLNLKNRQFYYRVARSGQAIIGFISWGVKNNLWAQGRLLHVDDLVVDEAWRGKKVGATLMDHALKYARDSGCLYLELDSGLNRINAHLFYEKYGFTKRAYNFIYQIQPCIQEPETNGRESCR